MEQYNIIDPLKIKDIPLIILCDDRQSWLSNIIKSHCKGNYNHIMELSRTGFVASQDPCGFHEVSIEKYMKSSMFLKFWKYKDITDGQRTDWIHNINSELKKPWIKRRYDFLGLVGQLFGVRWINNTWTKYCSEMVRSHIVDPLNLKIALHITPSEFNDFLNKDPRFEVFGYWFKD